MINSHYPPAHVVTNEAMRSCWAPDDGRTIIHYMQPHTPILERGDSRDNVNVVGNNKSLPSMMRQYFNGKMSKQEIHELYMTNLRYVLDEVEILLENVDHNQAVLTSDHGEALGEKNVWNHHPGLKMDAVRKVPWAEVSNV